MRFRLKRATSGKPRHSLYEELKLCRWQIDALVGVDIDARLVVDAGGRILYANKSGRQFLNRVLCAWNDTVFPYPLEDGEIAYLGVGGEERVAEMRVVPAHWEDSPATVVVLHDITARKERETMLRLYNRVFEQAQEGMVLTDAEARIISVNHAFTVTTGYTYAEVYGRNPSLLQSGRHSRDFYADMWDDLLRHGHWAGEIWNKRRSGEIYPEWLDIGVIRDESGNTSHYVAVFRDITQDIQMREEIHLASRLQQDMLRPDFRHDLFYTQGLFYPKEFISGDYYDYRWFEEEKKLSGCLIDVMGHGISAGLMVSALRVLFRQVADKPWLLQEKINWLNRETVRILPRDMFAAVLLFEYDADQGLLRYASAGISSFLLLKESFYEKCSIAGLFLGIMAAEQYEVHEIKLNSGEGVLFWTDGFAERMADLTGVCSEPEGILEQLRSMAAQGKLEDDATVFLLRRS
ncbi:PP2C family protein-serine/threonine phosphatase [Paradesulfitobacterium ferrireducens]|uniref:PP2C family protein-serine/threonine phosphatase n=1 Tax=Paradesulfitobacterium ferrireducens TaxID=2816476 RepID=UPI001A8E266D|nr:PP2C family protein-serine/threonine phosphatase [Paradesulfitobacterium ferrireducens]